jgi:hypothetical protein
VEPGKTVEVQGVCVCGFFAPFCGAFFNNVRRSVVAGYEGGTAVVFEVQGQVFNSEYHSHC